MEKGRTIVIGKLNTKEALYMQGGTSTKLKNSIEGMGDKRGVL